MAQAVHELGPKPAATDVAFQVLAQHGSGMHYKDLMSEVLRIKGITADVLTSDVPTGRTLAAILTDINLDSRFVHLGQGLWGLRKWAPKRKEAHVPALIPSGGGDLRRRPEFISADEDDHDDQEPMLTEPDEEDEEDDKWEQEPEEEGRFR
jgi:DNA-directed RNA polymerase subunit delta